MVSEVEWPVDISTTIRAYAPHRELAWLDSATAAQTGESGPRHSLICTEPLGCLEQFHGRSAALRIGKREIEHDANGWRLWRKTAARLATLPPSEFGLAPGWVGYLAFEAARLIERLPDSHHDDLGLPLLRLALFDRGIVLNHTERRAFAVAAPHVRTALGIHQDVEVHAQWISKWNQAATAQPARDEPLTIHTQFDLERDRYEQMVRSALTYIAAGDVYQVNLAQRWRLEGLADPTAVYAAVRRHNPAPYGALLRWADGAIASASPERFLQLRGENVLTSPIKGTRPRTGDPALDQSHRRDLLTSPKEAAELAMIVDLHRNDLGRVCAYGSVRVTHPRRVEAHPTVFHTVADVVGRLAPGRNGIDLLQVCFPAGSITGAPKLRAIQIIDELEPVARGAYTGAVGVLGLDGQLTFNVAIRTLQIRRNQGTLYAGGGIVADSDPACEYEETLAKARGILTALRPATPRATSATTGETRA